MGSLGRLLAAALVAGGTLAGSDGAGASEAEDIVARHMVGEALIAEEAGMSATEINAILKDVAAKSAIDEFWITDERGRAYLTNQDFALTFSPDPAQQPLGLLAADRGHRDGRNPGRAKARGRRPGLQIHRRRRRRQAAHRPGRGQRGQPAARRLTTRCPAGQAAACPIEGASSGFPDMDATER
jgi:hypothetical protein